MSYPICSVDHKAFQLIVFALQMLGFKDKDRETRMWEVTNLSGLNGFLPSTKNIPQKRRAIDTEIQQTESHLLLIWDELCEAGHPSVRKN